MSLPNGETRLGATRLSMPVIRAMIGDADRHAYGPSHRDASAVVGIFGDPASVEPTMISHRGTPVSIVPCVSALAVREALLERDPTGWLVIVTNRPEDDLGAGILAHLSGHKLRTPDPWDAVRHQFAATGLESSLYAETSSRALAHGLLASTPDDGWPPAPAGALTREHALASVARARLGVPRRSLDSLSVLRWSAEPGLAGKIADLRALAGDELTDAALAWVCANAGTSGPPLQQLLKRGQIKDALPLGLIIDLLANDAPAKSAHQARESARTEVARLWSAPSPTAAQANALGVASTRALHDILRDPAQRTLAKRLVDQADVLLRELGATTLAIDSDMLPSGLTARLRDLAHRLRVATAAPVDADLGFLHQEVARHSASIETAWSAISGHALGDLETTGATDSRLRPLLSAVRLSRWLASPQQPSSNSLADLAARQGEVDAWVDAAVNDAHEGVADATIAESLNAVLAAVQRVRDEHDREFALALASATRDSDGESAGYVTTSNGDQVWLLERLLAGVVLPQAKQRTTLLVVLDGMSTAAATEVVSDVLSRGDEWVEVLLNENSARGSALAVLPTLTNVSRTSLLSGSLKTGGQAEEQSGYRSLVDSYGLGHSELFHKKPLDTRRAGFAVADSVEHAIGDQSQELVTCILNTIDDALDRSNPGETAWTIDAIKHLRPLLDSALAAGRNVMLTADHGHVVERRVGTQRQYKDSSSSGRSRAATSPAQDDEILVSGRRVLEHGGSAVLPVNERLRYGPLKAGYHGGASPAEVVVPVILLAPTERVTDDPPLRIAPPQAPRWWDAAPSQSGGAPATVETTESEPALFTANFVDPAAEPSTAELLSTAVLASDTYGDQRAISGRIVLGDEQVRAALQSLLEAPSTRLSHAGLGGVLGQSPSKVRGVVAQLAQLLNVEGYPILRTEGTSVIIDEPLLREQFGLM